MLTKRQRELLEIIRDGIEREGIAPSFEEMKTAMGIRSKSGVHRYVNALVERGFIRRLSHRARAIEIAKLPEPTPEKPKFTQKTTENGRVDPAHGTNRAAGAGTMELPMMGRIAAGVPIEAISNVLDRVPVPTLMLSRKARHYALEVQGDSMIREGINDGDIVVIRNENTANNGDIVVALVDGHEATLKRFLKRGSRIALEAANPVYETQEYRADQVAVQGRLVGLIRTY